MRVARQKGACEVRVGDQDLEQVDKMKYLGVVISADRSMAKEAEAKDCKCNKDDWRNE